LGPIVFQKAALQWSGFFIFNLCSLLGLLWLAGIPTEKFTMAQTSAPIAHHWMVVFGLADLILVAPGFYHARMLPTGCRRE
jgi:hypothetical protein